MTDTDSPAREGHRLSWQDTLLHHAAAWGVVLCLFAGLWHGWTIPFGGREWAVRFWPGHLLIDSLEVAVFTVAGLTAGGWWWWAVCWRRGWGGAAAALALLSLGVLALAGKLPREAVAGGLMALLTSGVIAAGFCRRRRPETLGSYSRERRPWNAVFFCSFILLNTVSGLLMTGHAPPGWLAEPAVYRFGLGER